METESQVNFNENYWWTRVKKRGKTARGQGMTDIVPVHPDVLVLLHFALWLVQTTRATLSDANLASVMTWSSAFSRALGFLLVFTLRFEWLFRVFSFLLIGCCNHISFDLMTLNRKALWLSRWLSVHSLRWNWYFFLTCVYVCLWFSGREWFCISTQTPWYFTVSFQGR